MIFLKKSRVTLQIKNLLSLILYIIAQIEWRKNAIIGAGEINAKAKKSFFKKNIKACKKMEVWYKMFLILCIIQLIKIVV